eukprot:1145933-Pelagomonas_calceolata.AAC.1
MGMKLASKFNGTLMVKSELFELIKGVFNITGPANTQKDSTKSHGFCTNELAEVRMLPLCHLQLLSRPRVLTVLDFNQVHKSLVSIQFVRLSRAGLDAMFMKRVPMINSLYPLISTSRGGARGKDLGHSLPC